MENVPNDVEENGHGFTKLNAMRVMLKEMKTLLRKMQNCRALKARVPESANYESANSNDI